MSRKTPTPVLPATAFGAEIEVHNSMSIPGRGVVLIGYVRSGAARVGQFAVPPTLDGAVPLRLEISAVERLSSLEASDPAVGLIFHNPPPLEMLRLLLPPGSALKLEEPPKAAA